MKKINKILPFLIIILFAFGVQAYDEAYITSQTVSTGYSESCSWSVVGGYCHCNNYGSYPSECGGHGASSPGDCGCPSVCGGVASFSYFVSGNCGSNFCTNAGSPPSSRWISTGTRTDYTCHYISSVNTWSACVSGFRTATDVTWSTKTVSSSTDPSCVNVSTVESCNNPPVAEIVVPALDLTGSGSVEYKSLVNFSGTGTDPEGDPIVGYEWCLGSPGCASPLSTSASFSYGNLPAASTSQIFFRVRDDQGSAHWSAADSVSVEVKPTCVDSSGNPTGAPAGSAFCSGDDENLSGNTVISQVGSLAECSSAKCQYYYIPVDGEVGDAKNQIFCQKPEENLCDKGTPTPVDVSADGKFWEWTCEGRYGGSDESGRAVKSCAYQETNPN